MRYYFIVLAIGVFGAWFWFFTNGCQNTICRIVGLYNYRVERLDEYMEYLSGDDLHTRHNALILSFSCDSLRDQLTSDIHRYMVSESPFGENNQLRDESVRLGLLGARHDGKTLHMMNEVMVGTEDLGIWASQITELLQNSIDNEGDNSLAKAIRRLFNSVVLHAGDRKVEIPIKSQYTCD